jgi:hypothetical protein
MNLSALQNNPKDLKLEKALLSEEDAVKTGNLDTVKKLSDWVGKYNKDMRKNLDMNNADSVRMARLHLAEMKGAIQQMEDHLALISKDLGLPDFDF